MILCVDIGNTQIFGGIFQGNELCLDFHKVTNEAISSDELGLYLRAIIRENNFDPDAIREIGFCSVVPDLIHVFEQCCLRYFRIKPFQLQAGVKSGLKIRYSEPKELGSDRIANAIAAAALNPGKNIIIFDFGTATTVCALSSGGEYLGGLLMPGIKISMEALSKRTARLPEVEIRKTRNACGKSTVEGIQAGLYFGTLGMIKEIVTRFSSECFNGEKAVVIATGSYSLLFEEEGVFDSVVPHLVLLGILQSMKLNRREQEEKWNRINLGQKDNQKDGRLI